MIDFRQVPFCRGCQQKVPRWKEMSEDGFLPVWPGTWYHTVPDKNHYISGFTIKEEVDKFVQYGTIQKNSYCGPLEFSEEVIVYHRGAK